ncbi:hypothetical protein [Burkholderia sp. Leaf177]|uniref:hypothetical protein n=1 Tax=Burkholderia sp. Leaf177 TaxID=1736287 RepID=UPI0012E3C3B0|nr:hypothetical protein [Burkholderia sp. Leaf177]
MELEMRDNAADFKRRQAGLLKQSVSTSNAIDIRNDRLVARPGVANMIGWFLFLL